MKQYFKCITSIFLAAVLAIGCSSCADDDNVKGDVSTATEEIEQTEPTNVEPEDTTAEPLSLESLRNEKTQEKPIRTKLFL